MVMASHIPQTSTPSAIESVLACPLAHGSLISDVLALFYNYRADKYYRRFLYDVVS